MQGGTLKRSLWNLAREKGVRAYLESTDEEKNIVKCEFGDGVGEGYAS
jgi:hypothetical protein